MTQPSLSLKLWKLYAAIPDWSAERSIKKMIARHEFGRQRVIGQETQKKMPAAHPQHRPEQ